MQRQATSKKNDQLINIFLNLFIDDYPQSKHTSFTTLSMLLKLIFEIMREAMYAAHK